MEDKIMSMKKQNPTKTGLTNTDFMDICIKKKKEMLSQNPFNTYGFPQIIDFVSCNYD